MADARRLRRTATCALLVGAGMLAGAALPPGAARGDVNDGAPAQSYQSAAQQSLPVLKDIAATLHQMDARLTKIEIIAQQWRESRQHRRLPTDRLESCSQGTTEELTITMASRRLGWIGVDVGTRAVKLAQVARDGPGGAVRLHRAAVLQRPASWPGHDRLGLDQPVSSAVEIRAARQCGRFAGRNAVCALPMNVCQLRGLSVPPGENAERRSIIANELAAEWEEQNVAMEFDFWELETAQEKANDSFNVNMLAIARPWLAQLSRDCGQAGLDCWVVDGTPLAMARAVSLAGLASGRRALAIDWGFWNTTFCVVGDNRPWYTRRTADCGFGRALDAIARRFDVTLDVAQHLADVHGIMPTPSAEHPAGDRAAQATIGAAIESTLDNLCRQARKTLQFLETQRRHLQPAGVWLLGGGASLPNFGTWLADKLQLPVNVWSLSHDVELPSCEAGNRSAVFAGAAALSALAWRTT